MALSKMKNYLEMLETRKGNVMTIAMIFIFAFLSVIRLFPFENSLDKILSGTDDWSRYARFALDVKHNGISIPSLKENYWAPAGFLYIYFIAVNFYLFGENTVPIFIIQNLLLGCSIALIYFSFRDKMKSRTAIIFLFALFMFALIDVNKHYSFRLLSENLALFTVSAFFFCFIKGIEKGKLFFQLLAAVLMGLSILIRPNLFPFAFILIAIASFYYLEQKRTRSFFLFILLLLLSSSLLGLRNYVVTGRIAFLPTEGTSFGRIFLSHGFSLSMYINKLLFFLGFLSSLDPAYQWRPHWTIMWIGYFVYLFFRIKSKTKFEMWEVTAHLYIVCYYSVMLFIAPQVSSYGFRLLIPAIFVVLPFMCMTLDITKTEKKKVI
jgi:4-amino-4-deoxy-L-arabinose transferase-like glycosyltransferase